MDSRFKLQLCTKVMGKTFVLMTFMLFHCKGPNTNKMESRNTDVDLIGIWNSDLSDEITKNNIGDVTMTFTQTGSLIYDIHEVEKLQRINMIYSISGDTIISDQPSHPQVQKTKYKLENKDKLILEYEEMTAIFKRDRK